MKNSTITSLVFCFLIGLNSIFAQEEKAKKILDELSKKTATYTSMSADFEYIMENEAEGINEKQSGSLITKGEKYHLNIAGQQIICNGKTVWTVLDEAEEVQISDVPDDEESEEYISPTKILTLWEKGFKYKYDKASTLNGEAVDIINLYPEGVDEKTFHTIKLFINKEKMVVDQIIIKGKDGTNFTYKIKSFSTNKSLGEEKFTFSNSNYDVIDLR